MNAGRLTTTLTWLYVAAFFVYLFLPLAVMVAAAFNTSRFPTVTPWLGFTTAWFDALWADRQMWEGLWTSLIVGAGVIVASVPLGLAAALLLLRLQGRARGILYAVMVSSLLTPGVIIGISALVFWERVFAVRGGIFLIIVAQTSFIAAYCMLLFMARLERFDRQLEEAAFDLGASHWQVFRRILLPYLKPAILAAAVLSFLQSFENYNTTLFVRGLDTTLTIFIATKVRTGLTPAVNALSVVLIALTIAGAVAREVMRRRDRVRRA